MLGALVRVDPAATGLQGLYRVIPDASKTLILWLLCAVARA